MLEEHKEVLARRELPVDVKTLTEECIDLIAISRDAMSKYYEQWDQNDMVTKNRRNDDSQDNRAAERKEPKKLVMPLTASQVDTFVSFAYMVLSQREAIFELSGTGAEDAVGARIAESLLERDLAASNFRGSALQIALQNTAKFNLGVLKHTWVRESIYEEEEVLLDQDTVNLDFPTERPGVRTEEVEKVTFLGNKVVSISPYRFFPDPRFPIYRMQEGEFCGDEDEYSEMTLRQLEKQGVAAGIEFVDDLKPGAIENRRIGFRNSYHKQESQNLKETYILTEIQRQLVPAETMFDGKPLGEETYPVKFLIWYLNDDRMIRISRMGYTHDNFLYRPLQYAIDDNEYIGPALPDMLERIQDAVTWFINSRITSVRKVIDNKLVVDPRGIDIKGLKNRDPILLLKPSAQGSDVNRWIKQLQVNDVTTNHLSDVQALNGLARETTGLNENLLGQFMTGRRSATEARNVNANATARIKKIVDNIWFTALEPMGKDMLANHRAFLDAEQLIKVVGTSLIMDPLEAQGIIDFVSATREDIQGNYDFVIYDGTLPSEKQQNAVALQEMFNTLASNPQLAEMWGYTPEALHTLYLEILKLRGLPNAYRYRLASQQLGGSRLGSTNTASQGVASAEGQPGVSAFNPGINPGA